MKKKIIKFFNNSGVVLGNPIVQKNLFSLVITLTAYTFLIINFGWLLGVIIFLLQWGNNIQMSK